MKYDGITQLLGIAATIRQAGQSLSLNRDKNYQLGLLVPEEGSHGREYVRDRATDLGTLLELVQKSLTVAADDVERVVTQVLIQRISDNAAAKLDA